MAKYLDRSKKKYSKNLFGILFIFLGAYLIYGPNELYNLFVMAGAFLIIEHIWAWGNFAAYDFIGHEWLGNIFLSIGLYHNFSWLAFVLIQLGIIINLDFKIPLSSEFIELKNKLNNLIKNE